MPSRGKQKFTQKELLFVNSYGGNQTEAARKAGYKNPAVAASRLMSRHHIAEAIDKRLSLATKESARHFGREITFTRNDIIMGLADEAGLGDQDKKARRIVLVRKGFRDFNIRLQHQTSTQTS